MCCLFRGICPMGTIMGKEDETFESNFCHSILQFVFCPHYASRPNTFKPTLTLLGPLGLIIAIEMNYLIMERKKMGRIFTYCGVTYQEMVSEQEVKKRTKELGNEIVEEYAIDFKDYLDSGKVLKIRVVAVMKGAILFVTHLLEAMTLAALRENYKIAFDLDTIFVTAYDKNNQPKKNLKIILDLQKPIEDEIVLVVEDYSDRKKTITAIMEILSMRNPRDLRLALLLNNTDIHHPSFGKHRTYCCFEKGKPGWVVGSGMDDEDLHRGLPYIVCRID